MAIKDKGAIRAAVREARVLERDYRDLRAKLTKLRQGEVTLWRRVESLARRGKPSHLMTVEHRPGRSDRISRYPLTSSRSFSALAQAARASGLFCGCRVILTAPQPDGSLDICVLYGCSNEPDRTGVRCEYWCFTIEPPPVVAIAKRRRRRGRTGS